MFRKFNRNYSRTTKKNTAIVAEIFDGYTLSQLIRWKLQWTIVYFNEEDLAQIPSACCDG